MSDVTSTTSRGPSRRAVVRTAAHAAWAVPAIQVATSVPAFAAASTPTDTALVPNTIVVTESPNKTFNISNIRVNNDGPIIPAGKLLLTLTASKGTWTAPGNKPGWNFVSNAGLVLTFSNAAPVPISSNYLMSDLSGVVLSQGGVTVVASVQGLV